MIYYFGLDKKCMVKFQCFFMSLLSLISSYWKCGSQSLIFLECLLQNFSFSNRVGWITLKTKLYLKFKNEPYNMKFTLLDMNYTKLEFLIHWDSGHTYIHIWKCLVLGSFSIIKICNCWSRVRKKIAAWGGIPKTMAI
jgi:hypothetical protein